MIDLKSFQPFAIGGRRLCFVNPENKRHCIKVGLPEKRPALLKRSYPWWKRLHADAYYDENIQDLKIYRHLLRRCGNGIHEHLPRIYGFVETNLGRGLEVELILDSDGRISLSGKEYTFSNGISVTSLSAVKELEKFLIKYRIQFRDPFPHNLAFQVSDDGGIRAVIVDGLARKALPPFAWLPSQLAHQRIRKKIDRLREGLQKTDRNRRAGLTPLPKGLLLRR